MPRRFPAAAADTLAVTKSGETYRLAALVLGLLAGTEGLAAGAVSCHIHPPGSTPERPVGIIGPFDSIAACEAERERRFGAAGRCHCAADFSPRWLTPPDRPRPGDSPLG